MNNLLKTGDKLGYLKPKTGKYTFVEIVNIKENKLTMLQIQRVGKRKINNIYTEKTENVLRWLKESSLNFKDVRPLLKHVSKNINHMTEAQERYQKFLNSF